MAKRIPPSEKAKKKLSHQLIQLYDRVDGISNPAAREQVLEMLTEFGDNDVAKPFVLHKLEYGTDVERGEILSSLGAKSGITGNDIFNKVIELASRRLINPDAKPAVLARLDRARARPEIVSVVSGTTDKREFLYAAWALQDYYGDPKDLDLLLPRVKEFHLEKPGSAPDGGNGIFWINGEILLAYLSLKGAASSKLALELIASHPLLRLRSVPSAISAIAPWLQDSDPETRIIAVRALRMLATYAPGDPEPVKKVLAADLPNEKNPEVRKAIERAVVVINTARDSWNKAINTPKGRGANQ